MDNKLLQEARNEQILGRLVTDHISNETSDRNVMDGSKGSEIEIELKIPKI